MIAHEIPSSPALNEFNIAQLQFEFDPSAKDSLDLALSSDPNEPVVVPDTPSSSLSPDLAHPDVAYLSSRRMSSSATSAASTDASSIQRVPKRALSPSLSPQPLPDAKRARDTTWDSHQQDKTLHLPSISTNFEDRYQGPPADSLRRASLPAIYDQEQPSRNGGYMQPQTPAQRSAAPSLSAYSFPPSSGGAGPEPVSPYTALSSNQSSALYTPNSAGLNAYWGPPRPSSQPEKYNGDQGSEFYAGSARIAGRRESLPTSTTSGGGGDWSPYNTSAGTGSELILPSPTPSYTGPGMRSPATPSTINSSVLHTPSTTLTTPATGSAQRKRGKLPKETTDFLKSWLHRHAEHPYPSEEEKKQLCAATGLSMSQVSNWMINARRRILAPANRHASAASLATSTPSSHLSPLGSRMDHRRASAPSAELHLYQPLSLQTLPGPNLPRYSYAHHTHPHAPGGYAPHIHPLDTGAGPYGGGGGGGRSYPATLQLPFSTHHGHGGNGGAHHSGSNTPTYNPRSTYLSPSAVPLSAPPMMNGTSPFAYPSPAAYHQAASSHPHPQTHSPGATYQQHAHSSPGATYQQHTHSPNMAPKSNIGGGDYLDASNSGSNGNGNGNGNGQQHQSNTNGEGEGPGSGYGTPQ